MSDAKRIIIGQSEWALPDGDSADLLAQIESAIRDGSVLRLSVEDSAGRAITVFVNGRTVETVVVDLDAGPRPSEISG